MSTTHQITVPIDKTTESFRDKVIRKCGESVEMKEKFFTKYAELLEVMSRAMAERFQRGRQAFRHGKRRQLVRRASFVRGVQSPDHRKAARVSGDSADDRHRHDDRDR